MYLIFASFMKMTSKHACMLHEVLQPITQHLKQATKQEGFSRPPKSTGY